MKNKDVWITIKINYENLHNYRSMCCDDEILIMRGGSLLICKNCFDEIKEITELYFKGSDDE